MQEVAAGAAACSRSSSSAIQRELNSISNPAISKNVLGKHYKSVNQIQVARYGQLIAKDELNTVAAESDCKPCPQSVDWNSVQAAMPAGGRGCCRAFTLNANYADTIVLAGNAINTAVVSYAAADTRPIPGVCKEMLTNRK